MKIKTITCHNVYNFGASLQAYALMKYLQSQGHEVAIIDYKPDYLKFDLWSIGPRWNKNILMRIIFYIYIVPKRLMQRRMRNKFDQFTKDFLVLTPQTFISNDELKSTPPEADIYIAGSDQIWNTESPNGKDLAFFLNFAPKGSIKVSYAASFSVKHIVEKYIPMIKQELKSFDYISVRESTGLDILNSIGISKGKLVLDPVFLLQKKHWNKLIKNHSSNEKYILIYDQENNKIIKKNAIRLAKERGLKIYAFENFYPMRYANKRIKYADPIDFLELIKNCEVLLTNSFHGTSFSIIFQREFYVFNRTHQAVNSRMHDLLKLLGLTHRLILNPEQKIDLEPINYNIVGANLNEVRDDSVNFLNDVCNISKINQSKL